MFRLKQSNLRPFLLATVIKIALLTQIAWRYGEDLQTPNLAAHSTFHYELTRTLARAAGFTAEEAELIAVADEATDVGNFTGETGVNVQIEGTKRISAVGAYWHFARRDRDNVTNEYLYPGARNTCEYFDGTLQACPNGQSELDEIEKWAVYGTALPSAGTPQISRDDGKTLQPVQSKTLEALAIYLHALADSYSHEACMKAEQFRGHKPNPDECNAVAWHNEAEFGHIPQQDTGVNYTEEAAQATWLALKWYRRQNHLDGAAAWSDEQAFKFIKGWVRLDKALVRREVAVKAMETI